MPALLKIQNSCIVDALGDVQEKIEESKTQQSDSYRVKLLDPSGNLFRLSNRADFI
jgi:hypothetical protein